MNGRLAEDELLAPRSSSTSGEIGVLPCEPRQGGLYPRVDLSIWLRSCVEEPDA